MKFAALLVATFASAALHAECLKALGDFKIDGKPIDSAFVIEKKELKSLPKEKNQVLTLTFKNAKSVDEKSQENLYYKTLYVYDDLLANRRCPASTSRVFFVYPKHTVTIATRDLARVRKVKDRPKWQAHVYLRSQVIHGEN